MGVVHQRDALGRLSRDPGATLVPASEEAVLNAKKNGYEAIFIGLYHTLVDDDGKHVSEQTVLEWTSAHSPVPLFCFWEFSVGKGKAIGGLVLDGRDQPPPPQSRLSVHGNQFLPDRPDGGMAVS